MKSTKASMAVANGPNSFHIFWSLLPYGASSCSYGADPILSGSIVFMPERLLAMADKLLLTDALAIHLNFTGGEPLCHPFLPALVRRLLSLNPAIQISVECGARYIAENGIGALARLSGNNILFRLHVDFASCSPVQGLTSITAIAEAGYKLEALVPRRQSREMEVLRTARKRLCANASFMLAPAAAPDICERRGTETWGENEVHQANGYFFCGAGRNYLRIDPAGFCYGTPCGFALSSRPLWAQGEAITAQAISCACMECKGANNYGIPRLLTIEEAAAWLKMARSAATPVCDMGAGKAAQSAVGRACKLTALEEFIADLADAPVERMPEIYERWQEKVLAELAENSAKACLESLLVDAPLQQLARATPVMRCLIGASARIYCKAKNIHLALAEAEQGIFSDDERGNDSNVQFGNVAFFRPCGIADSPSGKRPLLSVIIPNFNKAKRIANCLESVLAQSFPEFEVLLVDDASTDGSYEILEDFARMDNRLRLWRASSTSLPGACRNFCLDKARGAHIIFVDSDDVCLPGYFEKAIKLVYRLGADTMLFGSRVLAPDGREVYRHMPPHGPLSRGQALAAFFEGRLEPAPWAKVFAFQSLKLGGCRFTEHVYHQDVPFFYSVLANAREIVTARDYVYEYAAVPDSAMRPVWASWLRLHSAYIFQGFFQRALVETCGDKVLTNLARAPLKLAMYNLEQVLLPNAGAWIAAGHEPPLSVEEARIIAASPVFAHCLLTILARSLRGVGA